MPGTTHSRDLVERLDLVQPDCLFRAVFSTKSEPFGIFLGIDIQRQNPQGSSIQEFQIQPQFPQYAEFKTFMCGAGNGLIVLIHVNPAFSPIVSWPDTLSLVYSHPSNVTLRHFAGKQDSGMSVPWLRQTFWQCVLQNFPGGYSPQFLQP